MQIKFIFKVFFLFFLIAISTADVIKPMNTKLNYLKEYAGTYEDTKIYSDKFISKKLKKVLGNELDHLKRNLSVRGPINFIDGELVIQGNAPHLGSVEDAILSINLYNGKISAAIHSNETITVYTEENDYRYIPISIKDYLAVLKTNMKFRFEPPEELKIVQPASK